MTRDPEDPTEEGDVYDFKLTYSMNVVKISKKERLIFLLI